jgi:hypothetical protein
MRAVLAGLTAGLAAVAAAASFVPEQAAPSSLAIALALTLISACLIVVRQLVWRARWGRTSERAPPRLFALDRGPR